MNLPAPLRLPMRQETATTGACGSACPTMGAAGKVGTAASFSGSMPDHCSGFSPSLRLNQFTIALWVFRRRVRATINCWWRKRIPPATNRNYGLYIVPNSLHLSYTVWARDCATKLGANSIGQMA